MTSEQKTHEASLRRRARKAGMIMRKSRKRPGTSDNMGGFALIDAARNLLLYGVFYELSLAEVEALLAAV